MKILLVNPPVPVTYYNREYYIPLSSVYLAAALRAHGEEIEILDMNVIDIGDVEDARVAHDERLLDTISRFGPDLIGLTCLFSGNFPDTHRYSIKCKERFPDIPIIVGGIHFTIHAKQILENCPTFDWIAMSEAEDTIIDFVEAFKSGRSADYSHIDGLSYRHEGGIIIRHKKNFIQDCDTIPFPAYDSVNISDYYVDTSHWHNPKQLEFGTSIPLITSRSCPMKCTFCSMFLAMGPKWRARTPKHVVDEIELVYKEYGQNHFSFMDDNFTFNKERTLGICAEIKKRHLDIQFETPNGVSLKTLDGEIIDALVDAGLVRVSLAIESGSELIRNKTMKKYLKSEKIYEVVDACKKHKTLYTKAFFIMGMPEETLETLEQSYEMIKRIDVDRVYVQNIVPFAGTAVHDQAVEDGLLVDLDPTTLYKSDSLFNTNYNRFFVKPYALSLDDLHVARARFNALIEELQSRRARSAGIQDVDPEKQRKRKASAAVLAGGSL